MLSKSSSFVMPTTAEDLNILILLEDGIPPSFPVLWWKVSFLRFSIQDKCSPEDFRGIFVGICIIVEFWLLNSQVVVFCVDRNTVGVSLDYCTLIRCYSIYIVKKNTLRKQ